MLFVSYGIEVFNPTPHSRDFCAENLYEIDNEEDCVAQRRSWNSGAIPKPVVENEFDRGICSPGKECYDAYDNAAARHDQIVFITGIITGLLAVIAGIFLKKDAISTGILSGGVLVILYGTLRYWRHANDTLKFILLGITLAVLVGMAYKKLDKR